MKKICILPFMHSMIEPDGNIQLCCSSVTADNPTNIKDANVNDILNNDTHVRVRKKMLLGEKPNECVNCWKKENFGIKSYRQQQNLNYLKYYPKILSTSNTGIISSGVKFFDVRFNNTCNLKCIMCSSKYSSLWIEEEKQIISIISNETLKQELEHKVNSYDKENFKWSKDTRIVEAILNNSSSLERLHFAGGEPLLSKQHIPLLRELIKIGVSKNLFLSYNTNGEYLTQEIFDLWSHFKRVKVFYSLDHIESKNEYIRYPSNWKTNQEQFRLIENNSPINVNWRLVATVSLLNIAYIPEFVEWKIQQNFKKIHSRFVDGKLFHMSLLQYPNYLHSDVLPIEIKHEIKNKLSLYKKNIPYIYRLGYNKIFDDSVNFMFSNDNSYRLSETKEYLETIDLIRGTNFKKTFPILSDIF